MNFFLCLATWCLIIAVTLAEWKDSDYDYEKGAQYWRNKASQELKQTRQNADVPRGVAKNVIMFLGDGMGPTTVTAGRILGGQLDGRRGEETLLSFDHFPYTGLSRTYNVDRQTTDSAASATAYLTGVKTNQRMLGVDGGTKTSNCTSSQGHHVKSVLTWFLDAGKSAGVVTTTRITHATPAGTYAHCPDRDWEYDEAIPVSERNKGCKDIAWQLIYNYPKINVIMGGGRQNFVHKQDTEDIGLRGDTNLIDAWKKNKTAMGVRHKYVSNKEQFDALNPMDTDYVLGLFNPDHLSYEINRDKAKEPSITEMTEKAIKILRKNDKGFFLLVEGGRIDHGHHNSQATLALNEVVSMAKAVQRATELTSEDDTLIVVTADHSHVMSFAGYPYRGNPILGEATPRENRSLDMMPYTTILYGNGPGYVSPRTNLTGVDTANQTYQQQSAVPMDMETHGGEDVQIYARGPQSFLYTGVHEQSYIPHVMAYAACVGDYAEPKQTCAKYHLPTLPQEGPKVVNENNVSSTLALPGLLLCLTQLVCILSTGHRDRH